MKIVDELKIYEGRKHLGPLDKAVISSVKSRIAIAKTIILQSHLDDLQNFEKLLKSEDLADFERKIYEIALEAKEQELNTFLGITHDRKNKNDKLPEV